jgi:hypothetical protein
MRESPVVTSESCVAELLTGDLIYVCSYLKYSSCAQVCVRHLALFLYASTAGDSHEKTNASQRDAIVLP